MTDQTSMQVTEGELVTPGLQFDAWTNPEVMAYTFLDIHRETVDAWYEHFMAYLTTLSPTDNSRMLLDISQDRVTLTPYVRERANDIAQNDPKRYGYVAFVFSDRLLKVAVEIFMRLATRSNITARTFLDREEAVAWLLSTEDKKPK